MSKTNSASKSSTRSTTKRLIQELQDYHHDPNPALEHLGPASDDELMQWIAVMKGVDGTAYEGGRWLLSIQIPPNYPLAPPTITFKTQICHPNIHFTTGEICLDLLKSSWSPAYTLSSTLTAVHQLLTSAEPDSPLNIDVALLAREGDWTGMESLVRFYTETKRFDGAIESL